MKTQVHNKVLSGKKVAVLLETEYISSEIDYYINFFTEYGAEVDLLTYLWGAKSRVLVSDVTEPNIMPATITVTLEKIIILYAKQFLPLHHRESIMQWLVFI